MDLTTVTDTSAVFHDGSAVVRIDGLGSDRDHERHGIRFRTLRTPTGALLARFGTVNDVHFGELECGRIDDHAQGPIQRVTPGEPPYPETMNAGAVVEMSAAGLDAVFVKGDLSSEGTVDEWEAFERCYRPAFGQRLHVVRGNHDGYLGQTAYAGDTRVDLPGVTVVLVDTVVPRHTNGRLTSEQLEWIDTVAAEADRPVVVLGHHPQWTDEGGAATDAHHRDPDYFGMNPDDSDALTELIARRPMVVAYSAGHTHRHRVRRLPSGVPTIEVGCVKDFPGTWAEHRVYEGGIMHVVHRISTRAALDWSERCRHLYRDFGIDYEPYALGSLEDRCFLIDLRR